MSQARDAIVVMGEIVGPYGVRGWLKVRSFAELPATLLDFDEWWLKRANDAAWKDVFAARRANALGLAGRGARRGGNARGRAGDERFRGRRAEDGVARRR